MLLQHKRKEDRLRECSVDTKRPTVLRKQKERKQEKHKLTELAMFLLGLENYSEDERKRQGTNKAQYTSYLELLTGIPRWFRASSFSCSLTEVYSIPYGSKSR